MKKSLMLVFLTCFCACEQAQEETVRAVQREDWSLWTANWSPDGGRIAVGGTQDTLRIFSSTDYQLRQQYPVQGTITKVKWHPIDNKLAVALQGEQARNFLLDLDTEKRTELDSVDATGARAIGWNYTAELLAVGDYEGALLFFDQQGTFIRKVDTGQKGIIGLDWHPAQNSVLAIGEWITSYDFEKDSLSSIEDRNEEVLMLCVGWHPSGELFVTGDYGDYDKNYSALLQFWTPEGQRIDSTNISQAEYRNLRWSRNEEWLATASEKLRLWSRNGDLIAEQAVDHLLWGIDWNPEGTRIVTTDGKGNIVIWNKELNKIKEIEY